MSFHVLGFYKNVPVGTSFVELGPITDAVIPVNSASNRFYSSQELEVFNAWAGGTSITRARVYTPWQLPNEIRPLIASVVPSPYGSAWWIKAPMDIPPTHDFIFDAVHSNVGAQDIYGVLLVTPPGGIRPLPLNRDVLTIRGDISGAAPTARQWSEVTVTWEYTLAPGTYTVVGSECFSTSAVAHRWIFEHTSLRPGALATAVSNNTPSPYQMYGMTGPWGQFTMPLMPRLEVLCTAADATMTAFLQLIPS